MSDVEKSANSVSDEKKENIRHDLVITAVNFLLNPAVIDKPYSHKTSFLKKKGLTDAEISLAYKQAESDPKYDEILKSSNALSNQPPLLPPVPIYRKEISFWSRISRFSSSLIVLGVALFGAHYFYKTYIEPLIFGDGSEKKSQKLEKQLFEMKSSLSQLESSVDSLKESINCQKEQVDNFFQNEVSDYYPTPLALRELKTEIAAVKSLLLNRHQFPALPKVTPTIPHWQLPSKENADETVKQNSGTNEHQFSDDLKSSDSKSPNDINSDEEGCTVQRINGTSTTDEPEINKSSEDEFSHESINDSALS